MARELPLTPHSPLSRAACVPSGEVKPQTVEAKEIRGEEETVNFVFNSHKKLLPTRTRLHCSYFSLLSLQTKIHQLNSTTVPWNGSDPPALHPLIPKTLLPLSHLLLSYRNWSALCVSEQGFPCQRVAHIVQPRGKRGTDRGAHAEDAFPQLLEGWEDHRHPQEKIPLSVLTSSTQGLFFPIRNNARKIQVWVKIACFLYAGILNKKKNTGYLWALSQHETVYTRLIECWQCVWLCGRQTQTASASRDWQST